MQAHVLYFCLVILSFLLTAWCLHPYTGPFRAMGDEEQSHRNRRSAVIPPHEAEEPSSDAGSEGGGEGGDGPVPQDTEQEDDVVVQVCWRGCFRFLSGIGKT
jgi:hypothetical protein